MKRLTVFFLGLLVYILAVSQFTQWMPADDVAVTLFCLGTGMVYGTALSRALWPQERD